MIDGGTSPDKKFSIVTGENKAGEFGVYLRDAQTKKTNRTTRRSGNRSGFRTRRIPRTLGAGFQPCWNYVAELTGTGRTTPFIAFENRHAYPVKTPELLCHAVPDFCQLTKELGGALTEDQIYAEDTLGKPWKARQNSSYSGIVKWISPTRFVVSEESQWQVKERDPSATLGQVRRGGKIRGREQRIGRSLSCFV